MSVLNVVGFEKIRRRTFDVKFRRRTNDVRQKRHDAKELIVTLVFGQHKVTNVIKGLKREWNVTTLIREGGGVIFCSILLLMPWNKCNGFDVFAEQDL